MADFAVFRVSVSWGGQTGYDDGPENDAEPRTPISRPWQRVSRRLAEPIGSAGPSFSAIGRLFFLDTRNPGTRQSGHVPLLAESGQIGRTCRRGPPVPHNPTPPSHPGSQDDLPRNSTPSLPKGQGIVTIPPILILGLAHPTRSTDTTGTEEPGQPSKFDRIVTVMPRIPGFRDSQGGGIVRVPPVPL